MQNRFTGRVFGGALQTGGSINGGIAFHVAATAPAELLLKAVDHISSPHAVMRAVALLELEQLARDHPQLRRTVCHILNAYLDLQPRPDVVEQRVRRVARAVLCRVGRLAAPPGT